MGILEAELLWPRLVRDGSGETGTHLHFESRQPTAWPHLPFMLSLSVRPIRQTRLSQLLTCVQLELQINYTEPPSFAQTFMRAINHI
jgi:hypothetical protein